MPRRDGDALPKGSKKLCSLLREMVVDEKKASQKDYPKVSDWLEELKGKVGAREYTEMQARVNRIITDEHRHYGLMDGIYRYVCGRQR